MSRFVVTLCEVKEQIVSGDSLKEVDERIRELCRMRQDSDNPIRLISIEELLEIEPQTS